MRDDVSHVRHVSSNLLLAAAQDLDSDQPKLKLPDGTTLTGSYDDNLGSIVVFGQAGGQADGGAEQAAPAVAYQCHTEKVLAFSAPPGARG